MPEGVYGFNKEFTEQQREADDDHGILQNAIRTLTFSAPNLFKFTYHYYYEYENGYYEMVDLICNDTVFSGTYAQDGNRIVATILAGQQKARDEVKKKDLGCQGNITGNIIFEESEGKVKVIDFQLNPQKMHMKETILGKNFTFKKVEN